MTKLNPEVVEELETWVDTYHRNYRNTHEHFVKSTSPDNPCVKTILFTETEQPYGQLRKAAEMWYASQIALNRAKQVVAAGENVQFFRALFIGELMRPSQDYSKHYRTVMSDVLDLVEDQ